MLQQVHLTVFKDGTDLDISGIGSAQTFIDNEITMMPYKMYSNIVSLSINDFKSFVTMSPKDKREIIDRVFSIEVVNTMHELVKNAIKNVKFDMELMSREIATIEMNISNYKTNLDLLKQNSGRDLAAEKEDI